MPNLTEYSSGEPIGPFVNGEDKHVDSAILNAYDILDSLPPDSFDHITEMAADIFEAPIAAVRIAQSERIWCRPHSSLNSSDHGRLANFSGAMRSSVDSWYLTGKKNERSLTMPLVAVEFGFRFYVSVPLKTREGCAVGTLCVIDREPRRVEDRNVRHLNSLATIVMDQMEARLAVVQAARQAETLSSETDHRVMNSLQFVSGLLSMQSRAVRTTEAGAQLTLAASRVAAVARVHRHFSLNEGVERVPVLAYLQRLCGELSAILDVPITVMGTEASVPANQILAIGFSVNEFVNNAKKYGAPPITVRFSRGKDGQHQISVMDEGDGLPADFVLGQQGRSDSLGMKVVAALVSQLSGTLAAGRNTAGHGACFNVTFPAI